MTNTLLRLTLSLSFFWLLMPGNALALQVHGAPEGLYVHQMAHVFYVLALGYFYWDIRRAAFTSRGWRFLQLFCLLMIAWNVLAFIGHIAGSYLGPESLSRGGQYLGVRLLSPFTFNKTVYFIARLDHLVYVPAMFCLFIALRSFYRATAAGTTEEEKHQ